MTSRTRPPHPPLSPLGGEGKGEGEAYARDGFVVVERLFSVEEAAGFKKEILRVLEEVRAEGGDAGRSHGVWVGLSARSKVFQRANADPRMVRVLEQVIGPDVEFLSDKVVFKAAGMDFGSPWHQDWHYWHGAHKTSVWIALDDATLENGCLKVIPGSHRNIVTHDGSAADGKGFDHRVRPDQIDESKAVVVPARAGTAVFFHDLTLHASFPNASGQDRWAFISTYRDASVLDTSHTWAKAAFMVCGTNKLKP